MPSKVQEGRGKIRESIEQGGGASCLQEARNCLSAGVRPRQVQVAAAVPAQEVLFRKQQAQRMLPAHQASVREHR